MKFEEFEYKRPDLKEFKKELLEKVSEFENSSSPEEQETKIHEVNNLRKRLNTLSTIARVRHSIDTTEEEWEKEHDFFDEKLPEVKEPTMKFYRALTRSEFRKELEEEIGSRLFNLAEVKLKTFDPDIVPDLKQENKQSTRYQKRIATAEISYKGKKRNLSGLTPFQKSTDRKERKEATLAKWDFFEKNEEELDEIYDELVRTRHRIAKKLGHDNFIPVGYNRMNRTDYSPKEVENLRKLVRNEIVPLATKLHENKKERLKVNDLKFWDENCNFSSGNPAPKGDREWIVERAKTMYEEMSPETDEFFTFMRENNLMDLENRQGKAEGGYCTFFPDYNAPFIFSNFNGTDGDIRVLTHEVGHAFQKFQNRNFKIPEYQSPTSETAEIHSMSMEFFAWPWMELFFEEDTNKFLLQHLESAITFLPYGTAVDEFQHRIYEDPDLSPKERKQIWRNLEKTYLPHRDYDQMEFLEDGSYWQKQRHIYSFPFYYIDYVLARICAVQFWSMARENREEAWEKYVNLCNMGGKKSFLQLIEEIGLVSPFEEQWVKDVLPEVKSNLKDRREAI